MPEEFKKGDRVKITLTDLTVTTTGTAANGHRMEVQDPEGRYYSITTGQPNAEIERLPPEGWPPREGDIWRTGDVEFVVLRQYAGDIYIKRIASTKILAESVYDSHCGFKAFKALNPVLARRRP
jgi:hypothetical protein